jgi:hypothetical protein
VLSLLVGVLLSSCSIDLQDLTSGARDASRNDADGGDHAGAGGAGSGGAAAGGAAGAHETGGSAGHGGAGTGGAAGADHDGGGAAGIGAAGSGGFAGSGGDSGAGNAGSGGDEDPPDARGDATGIDASEDGGKGGSGGSSGAAGAAGSSGADAGDATVAVDSSSRDALGQPDARMVCPGNKCKRVFISANSPPTGGNLGGLTPADAFCQSAADAKDLGGNWKAWLSDSSTSASLRLTHATVPYVLLDGTQIAANWSALTSGAIAHVINVAEDGTILDNTEVWTGTTSSGAFSGHSCSGFTSASVSNTGDVGRSNETNSDWTDIFPQACDRLNVHLYCFEQ